jgi:collagen triple helix repeat protein
MKKATPVLAAVLLVVAVTSGTVGASALLTGKDVKNGSLTGADIKTGSLGTSLFSGSARNALHGDRGPRGNRGVTGLVGTHGDVGSNGATGAEGAAGHAGAAGLAGTSGAPGTAGTNGTAGTAGTAGTNGLAGTAGTNGTNGTNGANGTVTPLAATGGSIALAFGAAAPTTVVVLNVPAGKYVVLAKTQLYHSGAGDTVTCTLQAGAITIDQSSIKTLPALASVAVPLQAVTTVASPTVLTVQCKVDTASGSADFSSLIAIPTA